jgi:phosphoglycerate dehydrogenase-like enzyme
MKPTAILVNTSRGPIVDYEALGQALREGRIGGAGLDVYETEPLSAHDPTRSLPRTVLTPHLGYVSYDTYRIFYRETVEDILAWLKGEPIRIIND